jgi:hypothetical protein
MTITNRQNISVLTFRHLGKGSRVPGSINVVKMVAEGVTKDMPEIRGRVIRINAAFFRTFAPVPYLY